MKISFKILQLNFVISKFIAILHPEKQQSIAAIIGQDGRMINLIQKSHVGNKRNLCYRLDGTVFVS